MTPELKARWIEALESGKYRKGTGQLRSITSSYCCLGVLCDLLDPEGWTTRGNERLPSHTWKSPVQGLLRDDRAATELGLSYEMQHDLAKINDNSETFASVIDYIQEHL